ncbi:MAG: hypothetical protein JEZ11_25965 [Desulfobacterales bacterium]|nr:hypothetical protein [Desulfobacterales bacterium]
MKKLLFLSLNLALGLCLMAPALAAELESVAKAAAVITVKAGPASRGEDDSGALPGGGGASGLSASPAPAKIEIKINQVINQKGNNPFNPVQPVYNTDGQTFDNAEELAQASGSGSSSGSNGGSGSTDSGSGGVSFGPSSRTSIQNGGVEFWLKPDTNQYALTSWSGFQPAFDNWVSFVAGRINVQTAPAIDFRIVVQPSGAVVVNPGISWHVAPGTHTMTIQEQSTGRQWRINFTNARSADDRITLTIHSVNRL